MRIVTALGLATLALPLAACTTPTIYTKSIEITKDGDGNVMQTVETESISQPSRKANPIKLPHLEGR